MKLHATLSLFLQKHCCIFSTISPLMVCPTHFLRSIFAFANSSRRLSATDVAALGGTCSMLKGTCESDHIWRRQLQRDANFLFHGVLTSGAEPDWFDDHPGALESLFSEVPGMAGSHSWKRAYVHYCVQSLREPSVATNLDCRLSFRVAKSDSEDDMETFERLTMPIKSIAVCGRNLMVAVGRELIINFGPSGLSCFSVLCS